MNLFQPTTSVDGCSIEGVMFVTTKDGQRHQVIIFKQPEPELFPLLKNNKEAIQVELFLLDAGNHIVYFDDNLQIIKDVYYLSKVSEDGREFKNMILQYILDGKVSLPNFITMVVTRFCQTNGAQMLISKPLLPNSEIKKFILAGKNQ